MIINDNKPMNLSKGMPSMVHNLEWLGPAVEALGLHIIGL
jgi:hypothetical protein